MLYRLIIICLVLMACYQINSQNSLILVAGHEWNRYENRKPGEWLRGTSLSISGDRKLNSKFSIRLTSKYTKHEYRYPLSSSVDIDVNELFLVDGRRNQSFSGQIPSYNSIISYSGMMSFHGSLSEADLVSKENVGYFISLRERYSKIYLSTTPMFTPIHFRKSRLRLGIELGVSVFQSESKHSFEKRLLHQNFISRGEIIALERFIDLKTEQKETIRKSTDLTILGIVEYGYRLSDLVSIQIGYYSGLLKDNIRSRNLSGIKAGTEFQF